jgi:hypothetical protein
MPLADHQPATIIALINAVGTLVKTSVAAIDVLN